jgi:exodeoxyribonuclease VII large subunit
VVTSPQAAALQDILTVLGRRYPLAEVVLAPTQVQGDGASRQIAGAISALSEMEGDEAVDVIIVARGGGSIEELWAFNEEIVARAAYASRVPVVSGVGHETDYTIIDYVADLRAPTPSAAAELTTPDSSDLLMAIDEWRRLMLSDMAGRLAVAWDEVESERAQLERLSPIWGVANDRQRLESLAAALQTHLDHRLSIDGERLKSARATLGALSPLEILKRGYAIVRNLDTGQVVSRAADAAPGDKLEIRVMGGEITAKVEH